MYSEPCHKSKMHDFAKIVNGFHLPTIFAKYLILDVRQGFEYTSVMPQKIVMKASEIMQITRSYMISGKMKTLNCFSLTIFLENLETNAFSTNHISSTSFLRFFNTELVPSN